MARNIASSIVTDVQAATGSSTALVAGAAGIQYQIVDFSGTSTVLPFNVVLAFGGTAQCQLDGAALTSAGRYFGENGPVTGVGVGVEVITTSSGTGNSVNLVYRRIF